MNELFNTFQPMLQVLIGGLLAILGGVVGMWLQAKYARRVRMDEIIAEKKVATNAEAYSRMIEIASMLRQLTKKETHDKIMEYEKWFFNARLFLPGTFPNKWLSIRNGLSRALRLEKRLGSDDVADELTTLEEHIEKLADEAIEEIYKEMNLPKIEIELPAIGQVQK
jgi:hypothetical protein